MWMRHCLPAICDPLMPAGTLAELHISLTGNKKNSFFGCGRNY